jgi:uncharacterized membrane protein
MVLLAALQFLGRRNCLVLGAAIVLGHNLLDGVWPPGTAGAPLWVALHARGVSVVVGQFSIVSAYPLLPWLGVMLLGFGAATLFELPVERRRRLLMTAGLGMIAGFLAVRGLDVYGDPRHWSASPKGAVYTVMNFLNTSKYPPSLQYLLMTLGPAAIVCAYAENWSGRIKDALVTLGRVPFAFYVAHVYLIHAIAVALGLAQGFSLAQMASLFIFYPPDYGVPLPAVYAVWALVVVALYPLCKWVAGVKARRRDWWLSYL